MTLAERKRQLVRDELTEAALKLLASQGFEETTIDQIVAAAGVSRRTFFRYFRSKEDVIIEFLGHLGTKLRDALAARPAAETPARALREAFAVFTDTYHHNPEKSIRLARLTLGSPALMARYLERQTQWRADAGAELARRMKVDPATDLRPRLTAAVGFAAFDTALTCWVDGDGDQDLNTWLDKAFRIVFGETGL
ncbi:TetR family transcriptional regulator [Rhizocola hellebori]|uniref:TetR family transcriptional regulator n=1 Tax=Rhizocola hellebori TaxID=1392758 RepID=A0A8J3VCM5_9ACTN|nr:TetR family transcriptional regulator [Rhizocola hellebori]GIH01945.1 TetR family transcriptional regulator [Rhizocola hellebori]